MKKSPNVKLMFALCLSLFLSLFSSQAQVITLDDFFINFEETKVQECFQSGEIDYPSKEIREKIMKDKTFIISDKEQYKLVSYNLNSFIQVEYKKDGKSVIYSYSNFKNNDGSKTFGFCAKFYDDKVLCCPISAFYKYNNAWVECTGDVLSNLTVDQFFAPVEVKEGKIAARYKYGQPKKSSCLKRRGLRV
jgi:hypothetical protein